MGTDRTPRSLRSLVDRTPRSLVDPTPRSLRSLVDPEPVIDEGWDRSLAARMPSLALPFAAFGAFAGFFATLGMSALLREARTMPALLAMAVSLVIGALFGIALRRWKRLHSPLTSRDVRVAGVVLLLVIAGIVIDEILLGLVWLDLAYWPRTALQGALTALPFLPGCLFVLDAGRRAARARHGSLVADIDRRTIAVAASGAIAFASLVQVPAVLTGDFSSTIPLALQLVASPVVCVGCLVMLTAIGRRDRLAERRLEAAAVEAAHLEAANADAVDVASIDLGLGAERWARTVGFATYRTVAGHEVLFRGSVLEAREAMEHARRIRVAATLFVGIALAVSALASVARVP